MHWRKPVEKVMLANGDVTVGLLNDEEFKEHIACLCDKYNTEIVSRQTFSSDEYEEMMTTL